MNHGLNEKTVNKIFSVFERFPEIEKVVLYGSRAKGNFKTGSDIDLTLYGEKLSSRLLGDIAEALDDLLLPYTIDLSIFDALNHAKLREHIERVGVVFYEKKNQNIKAGWEIKTLGEVCNFIGGSQPPKSCFEYAETPENIRLIQIRDYKSDKHIVFIPRTLAKRFCKFDDVMIGRYGPPVFQILDGLDGAYNVALMKAVPETSKLDRNFLFYFLQNPTIQQYVIFHSERSVGQTGITRETLEEYPILLPPLPEQKRLVTLLDEAFESIATAKANAQQNLKNARALFESHLNEVFTKRGEGWEEKTLGEVCILKSGTTVNATLEKTSGDLPYLKVADMNYEGNEIEIVSSSRFLNKSDIGRNAIIPSGTTIFPKRGGSILTNKKRLTIVPICADLNIMGVIPSDALLPKYLYFYFVNVDMRQLGSGSSIPQINNYDIEPLTISFPESKSQQEKIICEVEKLSEETQRLEALYSRKIAALDELKKALLHRAFSGEL